METRYLLFVHVGFLAFSCESDVCLALVRKKKMEELSISKYSFSDNEIVCRGMHNPIDTLF